MNFLDFFALVLAGGAIVDVWQNGSIFAGWRGFFEVKAESEPTRTHDDVIAAEAEEEVGSEPLHWSMRLADKTLPRWFAQLVTCPFCLSYHTTAWLALFYFVPAAFAEAPWDFVLKLPVFCLAATRLGNIINGLLPEHLRYQRK